MRSSMSRKKYAVDLTGDQRDELENFISSGEHRTQAVTRARILLKVDDGWTDEDISEALDWALLNRHKAMELFNTALDCGVSTVKRMRERFTDDGIAAIHRRGPDRTYERKLDGNEEARLIKLACSNPLEGYSQWSLQFPIRVFKSSHETRL
jgi:hypothetical protein